MKRKRRRSTVSKLMALCLSIVTMMSMSLTVSAAIQPMDTGTITINGLTTDAGTTVTAYKVINVNFDHENQQPTEPVYTWTEEMADYLMGNGAEEYGHYIDTENDNAVTDAYFKASAAELSAFYQAVLGQDGPELTAAGEAEINAQGTASVTVPMGQYLLSAQPKEGVNNYKPSVANVFPSYNGEEWSVSDAAAVLKGSAPGIDKELDAEGEGESDGSVAVGDTVPYKLTVDIPQYPENATVTRFVIGDTLSNGLTLNKDSIKIFVNGSTLDPQYYSLDTSADNSFTINMTEYYKELAEVYLNASEIVVKYTATVNENAFETDALGNNAFVGYTNDPYKDSDSKTETEEEVYTYGISLVKTVEKGDTPEGAVFNLSKEKGGSPVEFVSDNGIYRLPTAEEKANPEVVKTTDLAVTDLGGNLGWGLKIQGLDLGTYYLKETVAPDGYVLPDEAIEIRLTDTEPELGVLDQGQGKTEVTYTSAAVNAGEVSQVSINKNVVSFQFSNVLYDEDGSFDLPVTGGMGTALFTIAGILLMGGAVLLVIVAVRKRNIQA